MVAKVSFIWYFTLSVKQKCPLNTTSGGRRRLFLDLEGAGETYFTAPPYLQPGKLDWWNINTVVLAFCNIHLLFGCNSCTTGFMFHDFGHPRKILEWGIWDAASGWDLANTSKNAEIISTRTVKKSPVISKKLLLLLANWRWCWRCWCLINQKLTSASLATCQLQETWLWGNGILLISSSA